MINEKDRNAVRIIELPTCKMVWSGVCKDGSNTTESPQLKKFGEWWSAHDKLRSDRFYARDFMWHDSKEGGMAWGLAVIKIPDDTGGHEVFDFSGGLYAVANYSGDAGSTYMSIKKWIEESGCFAADNSDSRHFMWHFINPTIAAEAMGYGQYDFYFPIRIVEEAK